MADLDRRDLLRGVLPGLAWLAVGGACAGPRRVEDPPPPGPAPPAPAPGEVYLPEPVAGVEEEAPSDPRLRVLDRILPRTAWTRARVETATAHPLGAIRALTIHHSASPQPYLDTDPRAVAAYLERIRRFHVEERGWADIGYHFALDPAGRVWECRPLRWQGAHVKDFNEGNVGIVVLGNFELQEPHLAQALVLPLLVRELRRRWAIPLSMVRTHGEWPSSTECPGERLQKEVDRMRRGGEFG